MAASCCLKTPGGELCDSARNPAGARRRRKRAAEKYQPDPIRLLLIAEAPPSCLQRYFYFDGVPAHDALFRYVVREVLGVEPSRTAKKTQLGQLRDAGVWLIDLKLDPKQHEREDLSPHVDDLVQRAADCAADDVVLVKVTVYDSAFAALRERGLPVVDERIHFPGSGRQKEFEKGMRRALGQIGWERCQ